MVLDMDMVMVMDMDMVSSGVHGVPELRAVSCAFVVTCSVFSRLLECAVCTAIQFGINWWSNLLCKFIACSRAAVVLIIIINYVTQWSN